MRLCFVLLPDAQQLTPRKLELAAKQEFPELGKATWKKSKEGTSEFTLGGVPVITALMPVPDRSRARAAWPFRCNAHLPSA